VEPHRYGRQKLDPDAMTSLGSSRSQRKAAQRRTFMSKRDYCVFKKIPGY
jgi:hypothetical protein